MKIRFLLFIFALMATALTAQKTVVEDKQTWFGFFNQTRFSDKWGLWFDTHLRLRDDFVGELSQFIIRAGPTYGGLPSPSKAACAYSRTWQTP